MEDFYKLPMYSSEFSDIPSNPFTITAQNYFEPPMGGGIEPTVDELSRILWTQNQGQYRWSKFA